MKRNTMLYRKNLPNWERWLRVIVGLALIGYALLGTPSMIIAAVATVSVAFIIITGFEGFCPACALVGRKLVQHASKE